MSLQSGSSALRVLILAALLATIAVGWLASQAPPEPMLVEDGAGLMTPEQQASITRYHEHLLADHDIDYRVITATELPDINEAAVMRFRDHGRSSRSRSGRGLLLLIDPASNRVRLEVGYPLEGTFTDAFVDYVERQQMVPFFEVDRVADGILATTELIAARAQHAAGEMASATEALTASSGGAGAVVDARLGAGPSPADIKTGSSTQPGKSPEATLLAYLEAMATHDRNPELPIYTPETRVMLRRWLMTPAQMDNLVASYRSCRPEPAIVAPGEAQAVIRYPPSDRACAPFFFRRIDGDWLLDLTMMQNAIRFGPDNAWRLAPGVSHPYGFAFRDWRFDAHGYPRTARSGQG